MKWSTGVGVSGQKYLWDKAGLVKSICRSTRDWSDIFARASGISQECLKEQAGLVRNVCRNGRDWSGMSARMGRISQISDVLVSHSR